MSKDDNPMRHWSELMGTDPKHTRPFQRPGGFRGTAIKPIWNFMHLTEHFGPMGVGWGTREPKFNVIDTGPGGEMMVFCGDKAWISRCQRKQSVKVSSLVNRNRNVTLRLRLIYGA